MKRRTLLKLSLGGLAIHAASAHAEMLRWPDQGVWNPCLPARLPDDARTREWIAAAWADINPSLFRDVHVHLIGLGDNGSGIWVNPKMRSWWHPVQLLQFNFYLNASCADGDGDVDHRFLQRLTQLMEQFPTGAKAMLLAFDYHHGQDGKVLHEASPFHTPNRYAQQVARQTSARFDWIASIHPYRQDALTQLKLAIEQGAKAVKWLPPAMGIDPSSPRCDDFYTILAQHKIPLLTHAGDEHAVDAADAQALGNPLLLRRALDHGVKVIVAHCATLGDNIDLDKGPNGTRVANLELFARLMNESRYEKLLFGEIAAITQINRSREQFEFVYRQTDWHPRLVYGSDYPLPGVMPMFSLDMFVERGQLKQSEADALSTIRTHNPLLFDFMLKRFLSVDGKRLPPRVFESARVFDAMRT